MYPPLLGKFDVPAGENWVPGVRYVPEPPIVIRGSMNPWKDERTREVYLAEESAWKQIVPLQAEFKSVLGQFNVAMGRYNALIARFEALTGQSGAGGLIKVKGPLGMVLSPVNMVAGLVSSVFGMVGGLFGGSKKKKEAARKQREAEQVVKEIEAMQSVLTQLQQNLSMIQGKIAGLIQTGETIRSSQTARVAQDTAQSETFYRQRQATDRVRAGVLRERIKQVSLMQRTRGGNDVL